jgi:hypothetical protein
MKAETHPALHVMRSQYRRKAGYSLGCSRNFICYIHTTQGSRRPWNLYKNFKAKQELRCEFFYYVVLPQAVRDLSPLRLAFCVCDIQLNKMTEAHFFPYEGCTI